MHWFLSEDNQVNLIRWYAIAYLIIALWLLTSVASIYKFFSAFLTGHMRVFFELPVSPHFTSLVGPVPLREMMYTETHFATG